MGNHSIRARKRSYSFFSFDSIRSLARGASLQALRLRDETDSPFRSQSSLSCDPTKQDRDSKEPVNTHPAEEIPPAQLKPSRFRKRALSRSSIQPFLRPNQDAGSGSAATSNDRHDHRLSRSRPLSWFLVPDSSTRRSYVRSQSVQLPKDPSSTSVAKNTISAPVLQSTTNPLVARTEGVRCGQLSALDLPRSSWNAQIGQDPGGPHSPDDATTSAGAHALAPKINQVVDKVEEVGLADRVNQGRVSSAGSRFLQFRVALANKVRHKSTVSKDDYGLKNKDFPGHGGTQNQSPAFSYKTTRRRSETIDLCRDKIRSLTGHGNVRRNAVHDRPSDAHSERVKENWCLLNNADGELRRAELNDHDSIIASGSLTRSFVSAIDKIDLDSTTASYNMPFSRSKRSFSDIKGVATDSVSENRPAQEQTSSLTSPNRKPPLPPFGPYAASNTPDNPIEQSTTEPCTFSAQEGRLVPRPERLYIRRGRRAPQGVDPLGLHPDVMDFAEGLADEPLPLSRTKASSDSRTRVATSEDNDFESLGEAPIYSPSIGNLSQYSKFAPSPIYHAPYQQESTQLSPTGLHNGRPTVQYVTPRRPSGKADGLQKSRLKKSKSSLGLFRKPDGDVVIRTATDEERERHRQAIGNWHGKERQVTENAKASIKKSKSMIFGAFNSKTSTLPETPDLPPIRGPYSPAKPSPLRHGKTAHYPAASKTPSWVGLPVTGASDGSKRGKAAENTPIRPPRPPALAGLGGDAYRKEVRGWI